MEADARTRQEAADASFDKQMKEGQHKQQEIEKELFDAKYMQYPSAITLFHSSLA